MELNGEQLISASIPDVWRGLNDVDVLAKSIPGCEEISRISPEEVHAKVMFKIGPVRARFSGKLLLSDIVPDHSCSMAFEGSGGAAGFAGASFGAPWSQSPIEIHGTLGSMVLHNTYSYLIGAVGDGRPALEYRGEGGTAVQHFAESECFRLEIERFNRCIESGNIESGDTPMTSGEEALLNMRVTEAAYASVRTGCMQTVR